METEDMISLPASGNSGDSSENNGLHKSESGAGEADSQPRIYEAEVGSRDEHNMGLNEVDIGTGKGTRRPENSGLSEDDTGTEEHMTGSENLGFDAVTKEVTTAKDNLVSNQVDVRNEDGEFLVETEADMDLVDSPVMQMNVEVADTVTFSENLSSFGFRLSSENGCPNNQNESLIHSCMMNGTPILGVKRARVTYDEQQPSVHVKYNTLTRASKRKLEELLQQWSEWHAQHGSSAQDNELLESGEETYFPALCVGMEKSSAVSFWIENPTKKLQSDGYIPPDDDFVPLYDRGFALGLSSTDGPSNVEGGLEIVDEAARCFNCGSYNHSLKECPKPRDNAAVNNARKQHKSKRNQNSGPRNSARYYQNSSGGKYDGLKPGALGAETRQLLGLGELDPPPWLNRMRELGYPPGYLDPDDEDQPSGITIFADEDVKEEQEDGEIIETDCPDPPKKMAVEFPGINAPIPENADERLWALDLQATILLGIDHSVDQTILQNQLADGVVTSKEGLGIPLMKGLQVLTQDPSPSLARSHIDRGRRSPLASEDFSNNISSLHSSSNKRSSPWNNGSTRLENETDERLNDYEMDYSYRSNYEYDRYRHRSWRSILLMVIGLILINGEAMLAYKTVPGTKSFKKLVHLTVQFLAFCLSLIGVWAALKFHNDKGIDNFYSLHSWLGLACLFLFGIQWAAGFVTFWYPGGSRNSRATLLPWHVFFGVYIYALAVATATTGILEKATFLQTNKVISRYSTEALLVNSLGLLIVVLGGFIVLATIAPLHAIGDVTRNATE
ncbi:hypothetical protein GH714_013138 [Hevea brasiliensis]|uniref:ascorbate ferrireductase (transmembrane) n=1 Tax=Hevea brasiliensis TaxID=3981 RepID=A0A6A6MPA1_HEVBR|nr:hypothetical protein GH714_013138 [Hevea brasiliensis]